MGVGISVTVGAGVEEAMFSITAEALGAGVATGEHTLTTTTEVLSTLVLASTVMGNTPKAEPVAKIDAETMPFGSEVAREGSMCEGIAELELKI